MCVYYEPLVQSIRSFSTSTYYIPNFSKYVIVKGVSMGKSSILELQARSQNRRLLSPTLTLLTMSFTTHPGLEVRPFQHRINVNLSV